MRKLSDTIGRLATLKAVYRQGSQHSARDRLKDLNITGSNPGALKARTFIPENLVSGAPLVVALHAAHKARPLMMKDRGGRIWPIGTGLPCFFLSNSERITPISASTGVCLAMQTAVQARPSPSVK